MSGLVGEKGERGEEDGPDAGLAAEVPDLEFDVLVLGTWWCG